MKQLLFLCTGNYYRSRFAELLFNALAPTYAVPWQAFSRGLATELAPRTEGMSPLAVETLQAMGMLSADVERYPLQVQASDLRAADRIIALKEAEHRPYVQAHHPAWVEVVEYWHIHDGLPTAAYHPLNAITQAVHDLCQQLASH